MALEFTDKTCHRITSISVSLAFTVKLHMFGFCFWCNRVNQSLFASVDMDISAKAEQQCLSFFH